MQTAVTPATDAARDDPGGLQHRAVEVTNREPERGGGRRERDSPHHPLLPAVPGLRPLANSSSRILVFASI